MKQAAEVIKSNCEEILATWEVNVIEKINASRHTNRIILHDQLPNMVVDIADILQRHQSADEISNDEKFKEIINNSNIHGRHRATSKEYTIDQLIHEYIIFHRTLTLLLRENDAFDVNTSDLLKYILETAILRSATSFNDSLREMQETLMATLAHDLRNPLSTAYSLLQIMEIEDDPEKMDSLRKMATNNLRKTIKLTEGLMDAVTIKAGEGMMLEFNEIDIAEEVQTVYKEAKAIYDFDIRLERPERAVNGILDGAAIRRLLENLLTNAIKYGDMSRPVTISLEDMEDKIRLSVHNFGNPIPADKQESIFIFLHQMEKGSDRNVYTSWGMGLTLVKIVAESHGGDSEVTSNEKDGTRFSFILNKQNEAGKRRTHIIRRRNDG
ncbi:sensor histidine kinase [Roseivirga sp. BDSF3-8]|uniref:sensor histidine kinase n=1 Tax=Roseivirga sp. BDSF3-8 TaxID=3241598 RepID=UPI003531CE1F